MLALIERSIEVERFPAELKQHSRPLLSFKLRKILNLWPATFHRKTYLRIGSDCKAGFPKKLPDTGGLKILKLSTNAQTMFLGNLQAELRLGYGAQNQSRKAAVYGNNAPFKTDVNIYGCIKLLS